MRTIDAIGATAEEAVANALNELGVTHDQVEVEATREEKYSGYLGVNAHTRFVVRVSTTTAATEPPVVAAEPAVVATEPSVATADPDSASDESEDDDDRFTISTESEPVEDEPRGEPATGEDVEQALELLGELLAKMGVAAALEVGPRTRDGIEFNLMSDDLGTLIGKRGQTLHAIQYLANTILNQGHAERTGTRVLLDAASYRNRRQEVLERMAHKAAARALERGQRVKLDAMPSYERRIIHMVLANHAEVQTVSFGDEPFRQVIVEVKEARMRSVRRDDRGDGGGRGRGGGGNRGGNRGDSGSGGGGGNRFGNMLPPARTLSDINSTNAPRTSHRPEKKDLQKWDTGVFDDMFSEEDK